MAKISSLCLFTFILIGEHIKKLKNIANNF